MKINGYKIKEAISNAELTRDSVVASLNDSFYKFENEAKKTPAEFSPELMKAEAVLAKLQEAQDWYNLNVRVIVKGGDYVEPMTLSQAIRGIGAAIRMAATWKGQATDSRAYYARRTRVQGEEQAICTVKPEDVLAQTRKYNRMAAAYRAAIAEGNAQTIEVPFLEESLVQ